VNKKKPTFKRQRVSLALIESFGGTLSKTDFQKLLFLYSTIFSKSKPYHFIPYFYGCYSFQANSDLGTMIKYGFLSLESNFYQISKKYVGNFIDLLDKDEKFRLSIFANKFANMRGKKLISYVYNNFPYYTIHSQIAKDYVSDDIVAQNRPTENTAQFFTIGYEGKTIEEYINNLIQQDIRVLIDVRKNAMSMKYGFSKNFLAHTLKNIGIEYIHMPEFGIESENRQTLNSIDDYKKLFKQYKNTTLKNSDIGLKKLFELFSTHKRIAITCYEKDIQMCHRGCIANEIEKTYTINIKHI